MTRNTADIVEIKDSYHPKKGGVVFMKKAINNIILIAMFAGLLSGCGVGDSDAPQDTSAVQDISTTDSQEISADSGDTLDPSAILGDTLDPFAVLDLSMQDNSMDAYSAAGRAALQPEMPANALEGGVVKSILGDTGAYHFKKHLLSTAAESWDEVLFVTREGKAGSKRYEVKDQLWDIGQVVGTDHYVTLNVGERENGEGRSFLTERDENHEFLREFPLDFLSGEVQELAAISDFLVDQSGTVHLVKDKYMHLSQEGAILGEYAPESGHIERLVPLYDGRIALEVTAEGEEDERILQYIDEETGSPVTLATLKKNVLYLTLLDGDTLLYADREGVYRSGLSGENSEMIYRWANHGVIAHRVSALQVKEEGQIQIVYGDSECDNYLCLRPTTEEVPVCEITLGVNDYDANAYKWAVAEFNKRYPSCHVELIEYTYEDRTALLTQLTAGNGPVLLDQSLVGLEEQEELWEPLDTVMEQLGILEELQPSAVEMGKINGTLYGVVRDFFLSTVVVNPEIEEWDYDTFFQYVQDKPELESIYNDGYGSHNLFSLLTHGLDDNYFIIPDEETGMMHFDSDRFRQILDLEDEYNGREEGVELGKPMLEGKTLCNILSVMMPRDIAKYRLIYGEDVNYIGYPTKNGGTHFMTSTSILSIRRTAAKEEKEAAVAFLALYLSYEGQSHAAKDMNYKLSARKDVLEEQIASMKLEMSEPFPGEGSMGNKVDIEKDRATLMALIDSAKPSTTFPGELWSILNEERKLYSSGSITKDMLIDHLENRIGLYLEEQN